MLVSSGEILSDTLCDHGLPPSVLGLFIAVLGSAHMRRVYIAIPSSLPSFWTSKVDMAHRQGLGGKREPEGEKGKRPGFRNGAAFTRRPQRRFGLYPNWRNHRELEAHVPSCGIMAPKFVSTCMYQYFLIGSPALVQSRLQAACGDE
jgi:hypothetical protein